MWLFGLKLCRTFLKQAPRPESEYEPQRWEASALTTAHAPPSTSPPPPFTPRFRLYDRITLDAVSLHFCFSSFSAKWIILIFLEPPKLIPECPRSIHIIKGMDLHMDALVQSYPYPWVTWSHNGRLLQNTSNVASETRLKICNVTANQDGRYSCYAENIFGHDIFTVDVTVQGIDFIRS